MIDIHTHILPAVDDGVKTEDEAVEFARMAHADGIRRIVATPHCREGFYFNVLDPIVAGVEDLNRRLSAEKIEVEIVPGAEVHLAPDLPERILDGRAPTLGNNGKTLLMELSLSQYPVELENVVFQLKLAGIEVVLAHPERIRYFQDNRERYEEIVRLGAYGQITSGSILGGFGREAAEYSEELLRKGLVHVLASDAHNTRGRPPRLAEARDAIVPLVGERRAHSMTLDVPRALLEGNPPEILPVEGVVKRRPSFLDRWFGSG